MAEILDAACENGSLVFITKTLRSIASLKGMKDDELDKAFTLSRIKDCSQQMELSYENCVSLLISYGVEINAKPLVSIDIIDDRMRNHAYVIKLQGPSLRGLKTQV